MTRPRWRAAGIALGVGAAALYVLASPGRIDIIDAQFRFDVATSLLAEGRPVVRDPMLAFGAVRGSGGALYSRYGLASALAAAPTVFLGWTLDAGDGEIARFVFSLTSPLYGAATLVLLLAFYRELGLSLRPAVGWAAVLGGATLWWPLSASTFGQAQHGFFLLLSLWLAFMGTRRGSQGIVAAGGLAGGFLVNYVQSFALLLPFVALATLAPLEGEEPWRERLQRYVLFGLAAFVGVAVWMGFNEWRFGDPLFSGRGGTGIGLREGPHPFRTFDSPVEGVVSLLVSPGKGIVFYAPPVLLAVAGLGSLLRRHRWLGAAVGATSAVQLLLMGSLNFYGGDWAWGPRYLVPVLPLLALAFPGVVRGWPRSAPPHREGAERAGPAPAAESHPPWRRPVAGALIAAGVAVQLLGLALDHQRFFFERELEPFFWTEDWVYFDHSALAARPGEILTMLREGVPPEADSFRPFPYPGSTTYALFGPNATNAGAAEWVRRWRVFHLPRPWPLWMAAQAPDRRPFDPLLPTLALLALLGAAGAALAGTLRKAGSRHAPSGRSPGLQPPGP